MDHLCSICPNKTFKTRKSLYQHVRSCHTNKPTPKTTCTKCQKEITLKGFASHLQTHLEDGKRRKFKCSVKSCSKLFNNKSSVSRHHTRFHSSTPRIQYSCDICFKAYTEKYGLSQHILTVHSGPRTKYGCSICDKEFMSMAARDYHVVATHTGEKAFQCQECPAKFSSKTTLRAHRFVHTDERPHKCSTCSAQFKQKSGLNHHFKELHSQGGKPFPCTLCQKTFSRKRYLNHHVNVIHTQSIRDKFRCYFCKKDFTQRQHLYRHLRTHTLEKPFFCLEKSCQFSSSDSGDLKQHQKRHIPSSSGAETSPCKTKTWSCYFCSKTLAYSNRLNIHMRCHTLEQPFLCGLCQRGFKNKGRLESHISLIHTKEKPFSCRHCGKCFLDGGSFKKHVAVVHMGEKRFWCESCSYSSYRKSAMERHLDKHHL